MAELVLGSFLRILKNPAGLSCSSYIIHRLLTDELLHVLVKGSQDARGMFEDLGFVVVEVDVGDAFRWEVDGDAGAVDFDVARFELVEVHTGFDDAVGNEDDAVLAVPFGVLINHDFFHDVLDGDELGEGLDLAEYGGGIEEAGFGQEGGESRDDEEGKEAASAEENQRGEARPDDFDAGGHLYQG